MRTIAFIFARGGSKGVPRKNIREICGKPLIGYSIELAKEIDEIDDVYVSTDDIEIANVAENFGAKIINRPKDLAEDNSSEYLAWRHAIKEVYTSFGTFDRFVSLPTTTPLKNKEDIEGALQLLDNDTDFVVTMTPSNRHPYFNMLKQKENDFVELFSKLSKEYIRRQDTPRTYDMTTVAYVSRPETILKLNSIFNGRARGFEVPQERALDIDTEFDFKVASLIMESQKKC